MEGRLDLPFEYVSSALLYLTSLTSSARKGTWTIYVFPGSYVDPHQWDINNQYVDKTTVYMMGGSEYQLLGPILLKASLSIVGSERVSANVDGPIGNRLVANATSMFVFNDKANLSLSNLTIHDVTTSSATFSMEGDVSPSTTEICTLRMNNCNVYTNSYDTILVTKMNVNCNIENCRIQNGSKENIDLYAVINTSTNDSSQPNGNWYIYDTEIYSIGGSEEGTIATPGIIHTNANDQEAAGRFTFKDTLFIWNGSTHEPVVWYDDSISGSNVYQTIGTRSFIGNVQDPDSNGSAYTVILDSYTYNKDLYMPPIIDWVL